jgi:hypothetical protein
MVDCRSDEAKFSCNKGSSRTELACLRRQDQQMKDRIKVNRERDFCPHHILLNAAYNALEDARAKRPGYFNYELMSITFCALALEALGNSFGEKFIPRWKEDFESASPVAKMRLVSEQLGVTPDFNTEPWADVSWLVKFRNLVAHAKPKLLKEERILTREQHSARRFEYPLSDLEKQVTLQNAERAYKCVDKIQATWCSKILLGEIGSLLGDGWSGVSEPVDDN